MGSLDPELNKGGEKNKWPVLVVTMADDINKAMGRNDKVYKHVLPSSSSDEQEDGL